MILVVIISGCKNYDIDSVLEREGVLQEDIIKVYKPYTDKDISIYLFENEPVNNNDDLYRGGLITISTKKKSEKYEITSFDIQNYTAKNKSIKYATSYYRPADRHDIVRNYVIGGVEQIPTDNIKKPYIEFINGDILLIDNYYVTNNRFYYYLDIGCDYVTLVDSKIIITDYNVKYVFND